MKLKDAIELVRILLTGVLLYFVYFETGIATVLFAALIIITIKLMLRKNKEII